MSKIRDLLKLVAKNDDVMPASAPPGMREWMGMGKPSQSQLQKWIDMHMGRARGVADEMKSVEKILYNADMPKDMRRAQERFDALEQRENRISDALGQSEALMRWLAKRGDK